MNDTGNVIRMDNRRADDGTHLARVIHESFWQMQVGDVEGGSGQTPNSGDRQLAHDITRAGYALASQVLRDAAQAWALEFVDAGMPKPMPLSMYPDAWLRARADRIEGVRG